MPIYEYRCRKCDKRFSVLTLRVSERVSAECPKCGSRAADRLMSRFAMPKSEEARLDVARRSEQPRRPGRERPEERRPLDAQDGQEMGDELGGEDLDEMIDEIEWRRRRRRLRRRRLRPSPRLPIDRDDRQRGDRLVPRRRRRGPPSSSP